MSDRVGCTLVCVYGLYFVDVVLCAAAAAAGNQLDGCFGILYTKTNRELRSEEKNHAPSGRGMGGWMDGCLD